MKPNSERRRLRLKLADTRRAIYRVKQRKKGKWKSQLTRFRRLEKALSSHLRRTAPLKDPVTGKTAWTDTSRFRHSARAHTFARVVTKRGIKWSRKQPC